MIEFFKPDNASITQMLVAQSNNRGVLAHCQHAVDEDSLAAFLVAAYPNAFFGTGKWYASGADAVSVDHWRPAFGFPLGAPLANAAYADGVYTRRFEHVNVTFSARKGTGRIDGWVFPGPDTRADEGK